MSKDIQRVIVSSKGRMMVLHPAIDNSDSQAKIMKGPLRRRRSKGTIAGFTLSKDNPIQEAGADLTESASNTSPAPGVSNQPQNPADTSPGPSKACHSARLALLCAQNAALMGARTQLHLCPPGRARRDLQTYLRQRTLGRHKLHSIDSNRAMFGSDISGGFVTLDKMVGPDVLEEYETHEEDFLLNANTFEVDSDEEASSGDDDALNGIEEFFSEEPLALDECEKYRKLSEPLYSPVGGESSLSNPNGAPMSTGTNTSGKLPFNRRKLRYFDAVTATESIIARSYLQNEMRRSKRRSALLLSRHLKRVQRADRLSIHHEKGEPTDEKFDIPNESPMEKALLDGGVSRLGTAMTVSVAASLLIESLCINPYESLEGMAKCYSAIVAAGFALLESQAIDPTLPLRSDDRARPSRSEIMAALAPILVTSLEQPSGETILMLAKLRRMCGTIRYQRRFVQRIAPCLIRPPYGAMWCLRHQNDMEAILAAGELIFDASFDIFRKGWYERGRLILADSKRAETLNNAAEQLRNLTSEPAEGLVLGLAGHGNRRRLLNAAKKKAEAASASEPLAEWEVIAVDKQIRVSISSLMLSDWSKAAVQQDVPRPHIRRAVASSNSKRPSSFQHSPSADISPKSMVSSPRSPARAMASYKGPPSPPHAPSAVSGFAVDQDLSLGMSSSLPPIADRSHSPPPPNQVPASPPIPHRNVKELEARLSSDLGGDKSPRSSVTLTPPKSPTKTASDPVRSSDNTAPAPLSPKRGRPTLKETLSSSSVNGSLQLNTPLSPSASSVGTSGSGEIVAYKPTSSGTSSNSVSSSSTSHYRMLTSNAAERKRTVAACRALRAQIQRFEDAFIQLHGRAPKGAAERAPLATTYAQYREWKRAIRADAACRIQALFRGARARWMLLRRNNSRLNRVVMTGAGRPGFGASNVINRNSIPVEMAQSDQESTTSVASGSIFSDPDLSSPQALGPQWASAVRRRTNSDDNSLGEKLPTHQGASSFSQSSSNRSEMSTANLPELQARKRDLKQQLKQFDMNFARTHGRMPVKSEKEPIRHLYETYNSLKSQISQIEREGRHLPLSPALSSASQRSSTSLSGPSDGVHSGSEDSAARSSPLITRSNRKVPRSASPPVSTSTTAPAPTAQDLASLKAEKAQLHQMLRSYERDFFREHNRQVSSFADIRPVANQYRRYKEIKKNIASLQGNVERQNEN